MWQVEGEDSSVNVSPAVPSLHPLVRGRVVIPSHPAICSWVREHVLWAQRGRHPGPVLSIPSASPSLAVHSPVVLFPVATSASFQLNPVGVSGCSPLTVQLSCSVVSDSATPRTAARQASLSFNRCWSLLKLMCIESVMPSNHLILSSPSLPAFSLSQHQGIFR